jgi:RNA polymerase sigma-70 factor, ECF subfamily
MCKEVVATKEDTRAPSTEDEIFQQAQPMLFGLAYRMLGSAVDAADIVAEAYIRWRAAPRDDVRDPPAYLATVVSRLSIDALTSARARREEYFGPWLPEPLLVDEAGPAEEAELSDSLSLAFLVLLEELSPAERAAFLLHDVFGYGYEEVAGALGRQQPACRQLVARARKDLSARRRRLDADRAVAEELTERFLAACAGGDLNALLSILADDVVVWCDGGGKARAAPRPVMGAQKASRFLVSMSRAERHHFAPADEPSGAGVARANLNGQPGLVVLDHGGAVAAVVLDIAGGRVCGVRIVSNPDKLVAVNQALARAPGGTRSR